MKFFLLFVTACNFLFGCSNLRDSAEEKERKNITRRDRSITPANAYSNLFLDSLVMENFITDEKVVDTLAQRIHSFYNARNYQFAWFSTEGFTEQARGYWNLHEYVITYKGDSSLSDKNLKQIMEKLLAEEELSVTASGKSFIKTELLLTRHFIHYMLSNYEKGYINRNEMEQFIPSSKQDPLSLADSLINKKHKDDEHFENVNASYRGLKDQLKRYYIIAKNGGWPVVTFSKGMYKKGVAAPGVAALKKRLELSGDMPVDITLIFNDTLETGIKNFQERHGFTANGILTEALVKEMNVSAVTRLQQVLMNMDRMRWMAAEPKGHLIVVNIPEFILHMYDGGNKVFDMVVVVGKEGHNTMMFNGDLNQVVFSPYWNVPSSIVKNELLPAMNNNRNYLASHNMEIVSNEGELPEIRQKPGGDNALGQVKFLFPNSFNIYFHDTPSKSLFDKDKRAYSHGCIRLKEPEKMANYILRNQPDWGPEKIKEAMNSGEEKYVNVKDPIPVIITYYTAWTDENSLLHFREDIYGHDARLAKKMFK